jgi:hypothetical protein
MSERRPDPRDIRASLVDSGWTSPEPQPVRELPAYGEAAREHLVTRVDDQIQSRVDAMTQIEVEEGLGDKTKVGPPGVFPPGAVPFIRFDEPTALELAADAPGFREALLQRVRFAGGTVPLWTIVTVMGLVAVAAAALVAGAVASRSDAPEVVQTAAPVVPPAVLPGVVEPPRPSPTSPASAPAADAALGPLDRLRMGDDATIDAFSKRKAEELSIDEAIALSAGRAVKQVRRAQSLKQRLSADPGLVKDPGTVTELLVLARDPITGREALTAIANLPGPISADLLYEVWTGTVERNDSTELARMLLVGKDVSQKASAALKVALELRTVESCEALIPIVQRAVDSGDRRAFVPLTRLNRRNGCGANKRADCYPCLREGDALKNALLASRNRREPDLGKR